MRVPFVLLTLLVAGLAGCATSGPADPLREAIDHAAAAIPAHYTDIKVSGLTFAFGPDQDLRWIAVEYQVTDPTDRTWTTVTIRQDAGEPPRMLELPPPGQAGTRPDIDCTPIPEGFRVTAADALHRATTDPDIRAFLDIFPASSYRVVSAETGCFGNDALWHVYEITDLGDGDFSGFGIDVDAVSGRATTPQVMGQLRWAFDGHLGPLDDVAMTDSFEVLWSGELTVCASAPATALSAPTIQLTTASAERWHVPIGCEIFDVWPGTYAFSIRWDPVPDPRGADWTISARLRMS